MVEQEVLFGEEDYRSASNKEKCSPDTQQKILSQEAEIKKPYSERMPTRRRSTMDMAKNFHLMSPVTDSQKTPTKERSKLPCEYFRAYCALVLLADLQIIPIVVLIFYVLLRDQSDCGLWMRTWLTFYLGSHLLVIFFQLIGGIFVYFSINPKKLVKWVMGVAVTLVLGLIVVLVLLGIFLLVNEPNCADDWKEGYILTLALVMLYTVEMLLLCGYISKHFTGHS